MYWRRLRRSERRPRACAGNASDMSLCVRVGVVGGVCVSLLTSGATFATPRFHPSIGGRPFI